MNKFLLVIKMALATLSLSLAFTINPVHADDIEIYGAANSSSPPVNVMFIFDLSGSMLNTPDGTQTSPGSGESRKEILLEALTNVLEENKGNENLRVGFTWFNTWSNGINYPATSISADLHDLDLAVPQDTFYVYNQIPKQLEQIYIDPSYKTNIVGALYETAKYYRGDEVSGWSGYKPPEWNNGYYDEYDSPHALTYTPTPGPEAWTQEGEKRWGTCTYDSGPYTTCKPGFTRYPDRLQVNNCKDITSSQCTDWICENPGTENETCSCHNYQSVTSTVCSHEYWQEAWLGATYNSPIEDSCQASYIVLLSDGEPTNSYHKWDIENDIIKSQCAEIPGLEHGLCGPELVEYLANNDQINNVTGSKVFTYTIGFNVSGQGKDYLETLADKGKGVFYSASDASDLEDAFKQILDSITGENESFSSLVTNIKASTLSSDNRVFLNMFKPGNTRSWKGNLKGYFIDSTGLLDVDGNPAVTIDDDNVDKFSDLARSFWSSGPDGNFVELGGASAEIEHDNARTIYTYTDTAAPNASALTEITINETTITPQLLNVVDDAEKEDLINWLQNDVGMGDPLHAKPISLIYEDSPGVQKNVLFSMTNQGLLHAFDTTKPVAFKDYSGGSEIFAFIPQALLPKLKDHKANLNSAGHLYGLDGVLSYFHDDTNNDRIVNNSEKAYIYFGMRRGGRNYYALDVSNLSSPYLQWRIEGGIGDYAKLGQTWSKLTPVNIKWTGGSIKTALIFGGGYDEDQDDYVVRTPDDIGNAIYIADAKTGQMLWTATKGNSEIDTGDNMSYSIPSDIRTIDTNDDRLTDRLYFSDMGGQIWRVDLVDNNNDKNISGYRIADLSSDVDESQLRRFFSPPEIAKVKGSTGFYFAVSTGSGFRAHPNSTTVDDKIYMIRDTNYETGAPKANWSTVVNDHLLDITDNKIGEGSPSEKEGEETNLTNKQGWVLKLQDKGEKSLTPLLIFDGKLTFTTFTPANEGATSKTCGGGGGSGRFYLVNLDNATPVKDFYDDDTPPENLTAGNRSKSLSGKGIPTEVIQYHPTYVAGDKAKPTKLIVGKVAEDENFDKIKFLNWKKIK